MNKRKIFSLIVLNLVFAFVLFVPKAFSINNTLHGALVKIPNDPKVYILLNNKKYWIKSENIFNSLKYPWNWIENIDVELLNKYETAGEINYTDHHPEFTIIKYANSNKVYRLEYSEKGILLKKHIANETAFNNLGYRWDRILTINNSEIYPDSEFTTSEVVIKNNSIGLITNKIAEVIFDGEIDLNFIMNANNWNIISTSDINYKNIVHPTKIDRFSAVLDAEDRDYNGQNQADVVLRHTLYLTLPKELKNDQNYTVELINPTGKKYVYNGTIGYFSNEQFSSWNLMPGKDLQIAKAIKINQHGFSLKAKERYAYVGYWLGSGGALILPTQLNYQVYNASSKQLVSSGKSTNLGSDNLSGEILYELDLSDLNEGNYYLEVEGIGRSLVFSVGLDSAFTAFYTAIRGLYHQRAGTALESKYTNWIHKMCLNQVFETNILEDFGEKFSKNTSKNNPINISGGWFDAGDFDLRPMHLLIVEDLTTLQEMFPNKFTDNQLNIPESGNQIPDVLDEALWGIKLWETLQESDGGVRAGVESYAHPGSSTCEGDTLPYWTYAPNRWTSYKFAGAAAHLARILENYPAGKNKATDLKNKALKAWDWAEKQTSLGTTAPVERSNEDKLNELEREKMYAAGELFALTNETKYQNVFKQLYPTYRGPTWFANIYSFWGYSNANGTNVDRDFQEQVKNRIIEIGNDEVEQIMENKYKNSTNFNYAIAWGSGSNSMRSIVGTAMAYYFTKDQKYIDAISLNADYQLGENPLGLSWITGLGIRNPEFPLHLNSMYDQQEKPVPGLPIYGPHARDYDGDCEPTDAWGCLVYNNFYPTPKNIPALRQYAPWARMPDMNEFTVWQDMAYTSLSYGFLFAI
ncbi:MAG: hypothetical protein US42_C0002G0013 [Candidatus Magasanikbacteria bacterium GW2011_GWC2_37_14]|uniref:Uncharacterized protein n=1 Tax=Candidatus Magasanikbacteria bacterium GW2011_GWC2_37_14 TaxID=1619046 RepID=A0A0G0GAA2_9BACT|nr:MAG: hypothetical protein US42_C0002G0013 [Candidatus Magasanikbacteria bacterium GW2011_GWC2_37_14]